MNDLHDRPQDTLPDAGTDVTLLQADGGRAPAGAAPDEWATFARGARPPARVDAGEGAVEALAFDQRYEPRAVLGAGGMGEVRLCKDRLVGREVALKVMRAGPSADADARARFVREARVQGQLEHPAIVPVYDIGVAPDGTPYFTMLRVRGVTLESALEALAAGDPAAAARFSRRRLLTAFASVCLAVDFAHERAVLHRDLKPANIILGDFGEVHVLDWGIAKLVPAAGEGGTLDLADDGADATARGALVGTPGYMAPEQIVGDIDRLDARTDVYALGAILFEVLTLRPLHEGNAVTVLAAALRGVDARPSARGARDVDPEFDAICARATAIDPAARYPSARALCEAVERLLDGARDLEVRRALARAHVEAAREALDRAASDGGDDGGRAPRTRALRDLGSALALDPDNADALAAMARVLIDVPQRVPREALPEVKAAAADARRAATRVGGRRFLLWSAFLPLAYWMGIRHGPTALGVTAAVFACGAAAWWVAGRERVRLRHGAALLALSAATIGAMSALFGPFVLVPGLAATNAMFFAMHASRAARPTVLLLNALAVAGPFALEAAGVLPPAHAFRDGALHLLPRAAAFPVLPTTVCLLLTSVAMVVIPGVLVGKMRDALAAAERKLFLQAWYLRQLVPPEARGVEARD